MGSFELIAAGQWAAFDAVSGLFLSVILQLKRGMADLLFNTFCLCLPCWSFDALIVNRTIISEMLRTSFLGSSGAGFVYFFCVVRLMCVEDRIFAIPSLRLRLAGLAALLVPLFVYAVVTFWSIMISREAVASPLSLASVLVVIAYAAPIVVSANFKIVLLMMTAAGLWTILGIQWRQPIDDLQDELLVFNADLRQVVAEIASARAKHAALDVAFRTAAQVRSKFLEELDHRLLTPLNSISGYNQLQQSVVYSELNEHPVDRLRVIGRYTHLLLENMGNRSAPEDQVSSALSAERWDLARAWRFQNGWLNTTKVSCG